MNKLEFAHMYLSMIEDIIASKDYFELDQETIDKMKSAVTYKNEIELRINKNITKDDEIQKAGMRIYQLLENVEAGPENTYKAFMADINKRFDTCISVKVLYYGMPFGKLPAQRPYRYECFYRTEDDSRTEYVNIIAYTREEATQIFENYMKQCGYHNSIFAHSQQADYSGPLYRYEQMGAIIGANWY